MSIIELKNKLYDVLEEIWEKLTFDPDGKKEFNLLWDELTESYIKEDYLATNEIIGKFYTEFQKVKYEISWDILDKLEDIDFTDI